jgi:hypothetical protein
MKRARKLDHTNNEVATSGGHGFGLRANNTQPAGKWIERFDEWQAGSGFLKGR